MHTIQIGDEWPTERAGGLNTYFANLVRHLPQQGVTCESLVVGTDLVAQDTAGVARAVALTDEWLPKRLLRMRSSVREIRRKSTVDLIALHFALYGIPLLDQFSKVPAVIHFHGPWALESGIEKRSRAGVLKQALEASVYKKGRRIIVLSEAFRREIVSTYKVPDSKVRVVPGGADTQRFANNLTRSEARRQLGWPQDRPIIFCIRRLVRRMGLEALIDSARELAAKKLDFYLYIAGTGPIAAELKQRIEQRGLHEHVKLLGRVSDDELPVMYQAANFSVVPSQALEGFGLIAAESLACGTPVLVTPVGGLPEILTPFAPELIFEDATISSIVRGLRGALENLEALPTRDACRTYAADHYSWDKVAVRVANVYREATA